MSKEKKGRISLRAYKRMWSQLKEIAGKKDPEFEELWPLLETLGEFMREMEEVNKE